MNGRLTAKVCNQFALDIPQILTPAADIKITPHDSFQLGAGLFDSPVATFLVECAIYLAGLWVYTTFAPITTKVGYKTHKNRLWGITLFLIGAQAHFAFGS